MAVWTPEQVAQLAYAVGLRGESAAIAVAITDPESGRNTEAVGDEHLTNATWGPSVGLWQIRTLKAKKGTGHYRDIDTLFGPINNANAMRILSGGGTKWRDWTAYNNGSYKKHLERARQAVRAVEAAAGSGAIPTPLDPIPSIPGSGLGIPTPSDPSYGAFADPSQPDPVLEGAKRAAGVVTGGITGIGGLIGTAIEVLQRLLEPGFWLRVGLGLAGVVLVLGAAVLIFGKDVLVLVPGGGLAKAATTAAGAAKNVAKEAA